MRKKLFYLLLLFGVMQGFGQKKIFNEPMPDQYTFFNLAHSLNYGALASAPDRFSDELSTVYITMPVNDKGENESFQIYRTHYLEKSLEKKYPALQTFVGKSSSGKTAYITLTPYFSSAVILRPGEPTFLIKQYDDQKWIGFAYVDQKVPGDFICQTDETDISFEPGTVSEARPSYDDRILRKYKYAISTTGEFSGYHLNRLGIPSTASDYEKKQAVLGALTEAVTRMNSVYERDFAISLQIVSNNDNVIYLDPDNDPFDNYASDMSMLIYTNHRVLNDNIGSSNYDVGQVWCYGQLQGLARLGVVCDDGGKGMGAVRGEYPETDRFIISVASHELGHQYGAFHVFYNSCGGNRSDDHAVEPGSGTTIMAYAGICPPNIQYYTDDRFNAISIADFEYFLNITGSCSQNISLTNSAPVVEAGLGRYIPQQTPFWLTAVANDADDDVLTYTWDEQDIPDHNYSTPPQSTWRTGPLFRPYPVQTENYRTFPLMDSLLVIAPETSTRWEVLPEVTRLIRFRVTVRDNNPEGGQIAQDNITLGIDTTAGPFRVTSQTTPETWYPGDSITITWDVAGTDQGQVNCQFVDIIMALDGRNFVDTLASVLPNNGIYRGVVPDHFHSPQARFIVKAHNNYFFALNAAPITIGDYEVSCGHNYTTAAGLAIPDNDPRGITDTLYIAENKSIADVNLYVNISHTWVGDLTIELISPRGTSVVVWENTCSDNENLNVVFDDEGADIVCSNLTGNIKPINPLQIFDGEYTEGNWIIKISDNADQDTGTLNEWGLEFCYQELGAETSLWEGVNVYPVPVKDFVNITWPRTSGESVRIAIYDMNGRLIKDVIVEDGTTGMKKLDASEWAAGNYIIKLSQGNKIYHTILMKH